MADLSYPQRVQQLGLNCPVQRTYAIDRRVAARSEIILRLAIHLKGHLAVQKAVLHLSERVRDGKVVRVGFDGPRNRLHIFANHEGSQVDGIDGMDVDYDNEDDLKIEEMD
jgi:hypothetical protein